MLLHDDLGARIQAALERDLSEGARLKRPSDRGDKDSLEGYCAVAAAAYFFLAGGCSSGLQPMQLTRDGRSHWWLERTSDGAVIDLTVRPAEHSSFPYPLGTRRAFMQHGYRQPSSRARALIQRVEAEARSTLTSERRCASRCTEETSDLPSTQTNRHAAAASPAIAGARWHTGNVEGVTNAAQ